MIQSPDDAYCEDNDKYIVNVINSKNMCVYVCVRERVRQRYSVWILDSNIATGGLHTLHTLTLQTNIPAHTVQMPTET